MLAHANTVSIHNSKLISADTVTHNHFHHDKDPLEQLRNHVVHGALFDSAQRYDPPKCHPQTRIAVLDNIDKWAKGDLKPGKPILWLRGGAGAGKSAIAQTMSERWSESSHLAASFYYSRTAAGRNESKYFVATLADQLLKSVPITRQYIEHAIVEDRMLFHTSLRDQFMALIANPLMVPYTGILPAKVVVIDGLDECCLDYPDRSYETQQQEILEVIALAAQYSLPLRFLVASRPERQIRQSFHQQSLAHLYITITLDNSKNPDADIDLFLRCNVRILREENDELEENWPSDELIHALVKRSSGHFIYASTVLRCISNPRTDPKKTLDIILGLSVPDDNLHNPFAQLDALYFHIIDSACRQQSGSIITMRQILGIITHCSDSFSPRYYRVPFHGLANFSVEFFSTLLFTTKKAIECSLTDLHSIFEIPHKRHTKDKPIKFLHASFGEFLSDRLRSGPFYIDSAQAQLHCNIFIAKHAVVSIVQGSEPSKYNTDAVERILVDGLEGNRCPPSKELKFALHALIGKSNNTYLENLKRIGMHADFRAGTLRRSLTSKDRLIVLSYLQRCNIESIETSSTRRWLMTASLIGQKVRTRIWIFFLAYQVLLYSLIAFVVMLLVIAIGLFVGLKPLLDYLAQKH